MNFSRTPRFTLLVPTYNGARTLYDTIESLLNQTEDSIEIFVLDNGSNDSSEAIIESFQDSRITYRKYDHSRSIGESLNRAFELPIRSKYFSICHSDDVYHPDYVQKMIKVMDHCVNSGIVFCQSWLIDGDGRLLRTRYSWARNLYSGWLPFFYGKIGVIRILFWNNLVAPSAVFRLSQVQNYPRFGLNQVYFTDVHFWLKYLLGGGTIFIAGHKLIYYRVHNGQVSKKKRQLKSQWKELDSLYRELFIEQSDSAACWRLIFVMVKTFKFLTLLK